MLHFLLNGDEQRLNRGLFILWVKLKKKKPKHICWSLTPQREICPPFDISLSFSVFDSLCFSLSVARPAVHLGPGESAAPVPGALWGGFTRSHPVSVASNSTRNWRETRTQVHWSGYTHCNENYSLSSTARLHHLHLTYCSALWEFRSIQAIQYILSIMNKTSSTEYSGCLSQCTHSHPNTRSIMKNFSFHMPILPFLHFFSGLLFLSVLLWLIQHLSFHFCLSLS